MQTRSRNVLLLGGDSPAIARARLCSGPLTAQYTGGDLRYIRYGNVELLRRIHFAVRDHNWGTIPPTLSNIQVEAAESSFQISYDFENRANDIDVAGRVRIAGDAGGTIEFEMDGQARSAFMTNRIGICVLHPISCAGASVVVAKDGGARLETQFPSSISPHQPFMNIRALRHEFAPGAWADVAFEGDVFETEDQRNWGDASFKTYCPPLSIAFPRRVEAGERFRQRITLTLHGAAQAPAVVAEPQNVRLTLEAGEGARLPHIGLALPKGDAPLTEQQASRIRLIKPAHLRADFDLTGSEWPSPLAYAAEQSALLGAPIDAALLVEGDSKAALQSFAEEIARTKPAIETFLVFDRATHLTGPATLRLARELLAPTYPHAAFGGGTNAYFAELNRGPREFGHLDRVSFPMNPQVHAFDEISIVETADALPDMVRSCRALVVGELPVSVSPITLKPRFNPVATAREKAPAPDTLPSTADVRQMSLFGAAWTLSSVRALAEAQVESATYYQTHGFEGVMASADAGAMAAQFPAAPGEVYPMYHVFADLGECASWEAIGVESSDPLAVQALALRHGNRVRILAANLTAEPQPIEIVGFDAPVRLRPLDERNAEFAMANPEAYRSGSWQVRLPHRGTLRITLEPYAYAMMDGNRQ